MPWYRLNLHGFVEAESESAARQCFIDGDWGDISLDGVEEFKEGGVCQFCNAAISWDRDADKWVHDPPWGEHEEPIVVGVEETA